MYRRSTDNKAHQWEEFDCPFAGRNQERVAKILGESRREGEVGEKLPDFFKGGRHEINSTFSGICPLSLVSQGVRGLPKSYKVFFVCV